jgi:hypothetical protein
MYRIVPSRYRSAESVDHLFKRAECVFEYAYCQFLQECKGLTRKGVGDKFVEALPSLVSAEVERRYLREARGFELYEAIARGALDDAKRADASTEREFDLAEAWSRLGKVARYRRDWKRGIECLDSAIWRLEKLAGESRSHSEVARQELADARFLLGEIYMARFLGSRDANDRADAKAQFEACLALDQPRFLASFSASRLQELAEIPG